MKNRSPATHRAQKVYRWLTLISLLLMFGPLLGYGIVALLSGALLTQKLKLACTVVVALILTIVSLVNHIAYKSRVWIIVLGLFLVIDNFLPCILTVAITQLLEELVVSPLRDRAKAKLITNREIDKRMPAPAPVATTATTPTATPAP